MGKNGFVNEDKIADYLDGKSYSELNNNWKQNIKYLNHKKELSPNTKIKANALHGAKKADLLISFNGKTSYISVKKGSGNSVHQEKIEFFIDYIKKFEPSDKVISSLKQFIDSYDDGNVYFEKHPDQKEDIQDFFNQNARDLMVRFLKTGRFSNGHAEYIYHGKIDEGKIRSIDSVIDEMIEEPPSGNAQLYVGCLTFQKWNTRNEKKRGSIQLKSPTLRKFLK